MPVTVDVLIKQSWTVGESLSFLLLVYPKFFFISPPWIVVWYGLSLYWMPVARYAERRVMLKTWYFVMAVIGATIPTVFDQSSRYFFSSSSSQIRIEVLSERWLLIICVIYQTVPEGDWFCPECRPKQRSRRLSSRQRPSLESDDEMEGSMSKWRGRVWGRTRWRWFSRRRSSQVSPNMQ